MKKELTASQVNKKYKGRYVSITSRFDYSTGQKMYTVNKTYSDIHEDTTLGEDVGTALEYRR